MEDIFEQYKAFRRINSKKENGPTSKTLEQYCKDVEFVLQLCTCKPEDMCKDEKSLEFCLDKYRQYVRKNKLDKTTLDNYINNCKTFYKFWQERKTSISYYWVNQGKEYPNNIDFIQAPDDNLEGHKLVQELKMGDKILSYVNREGGIFRELIVVSTPESIEKENDTRNWYRVKVKETKLKNSISLTDIKNLKIDLSKINRKNIPWNSNYKKVKEKRYLINISQNLYKEIINIKSNNMSQTEVISMLKSNNTHTPLNQILYGPPGTGKTYNTIIKAMEIIKEEKLTDDNNKLLPQYEYATLRDDFEKYKNQNRIEFITFHQSYSYEEFVEGIKPYIDKWGEDNPQDVKYIGKDGIFKNLVKNALFEMLDIKDDYKNSYAEFNNLKEKFVQKNDIGTEFNTCTNKTFKIMDYTKTNIQIMPIDGKTKYSLSFENIEKFMKDLSKLNKNAAEITRNDLVDIKKTSLGLASYYLPIVQEFLELSGNLNTAIPKDTVINADFKEKSIRDYYDGKISLRDNAEPYILVIDEINRGNISKIFGELITLIEKDKRNTMTVTLPYSQEKFTVPNNLYIIGTMNTSDRSIASVDIALRRRFKFVEMMPDLSIVPEYFKDKLEILNKKISILLDRDHQIGHSYFIGTTKDDLPEIWFNSIMPLLNEYFYGDWEKLQEILGKAEDEKSDKIYNSFIKKINCSCIKDSDCFDNEEDCFDFVKINEINFDKAIENAFKKPEVGEDSDADNKNS